jgi:hypothetical protein
MITLNREIEAKDVKRLMLRVYKRYSSGAITESKAYKETYILNSVLKAIEVTDLEERLQTLEAMLKD